MCAWSHMCAWSCCSDTLTMYQLVKQPRASPCRGLAFHEVVLLCSLSFSPVQSIITLSSFETAKHCALPARCKPLVKWPGAYRNVQDKRFIVNCQVQALIVMEKERETHYSLPVSLRQSEARRRLFTAF